MIAIAGISFVCPHIVGAVAIAIGRSKPDSRFNDLDYRNKFRRKVLYICLAIQAAAVIALLIIGGAL